LLEINKFFLASTEFVTIQWSIGGGGLAAPIFHYFILLFTQKSSRSGKTLQRLLSFAVAIEFCKFLS